MALLMDVTAPANAFLWNTKSLRSPAAIGCTNLRSAYANDRNISLQTRLHAFGSLDDDRVAFVVTEVCLEGKSSLASAEALATPPSSCKLTLSNSAVAGPASTAKTSRLTVVTLPPGAVNWIFRVAKYSPAVKPVAFVASLKGQASSPLRC